MFSFKKRRTSLLQREQIEYIHLEKKAPTKIEITELGISKIVIVRIDKHGAVCYH